MKFVILDNDDLDEVKKIRSLIHAEWDKLNKRRHAMSPTTYCMSIDAEMECLLGYIGDLDTAIEEYQGQRPPVDEREERIFSALVGVLERADAAAKANLARREGGEAKEESV